VAPAGVVISSLGRRRSELGVRASGCEAGEVKTTLDSVRQRELDPAVHKLLEVLGSQLGCLDDLHLHDLDRAGSCAMTCTHVTVALGNGAGSRQVAILAVHVVRAAARVVAQPDAKVLNGRRSLLVHLLTEEDLALSLLNLSQHGRKVPVARLGLRSVRRKDAHLVDGRCPLLVRRHHPTNHLVLLQSSRGPHGCCTKK